MNRAARVMAIAHGGQILVSDITARLVRSGPTHVALVDLGVHRLRDLADPEHVWQVIDPDLPSAFPPLRSMDTMSNNLPTQRSSFVGREVDVERLVSLLRRHRTVTVTGAGGVGKTRLAVHAAGDVLAEFEAVWFVDVAELTSADEILASVAAAARLEPSVNPLEVAVAAFGRQRVLLVLDGCEHLVDAAAEAVDRLTVSCPDLHVLATSREPLGVEGEHVVVIRPLDVDDAAPALFEQRAAAGGAVLDGSHRPIVRRICERLDGLPLAIELAASRVASLGLPAILSALDDRFSILSDRRRRAPARHRTLRATVDWSYRLLTPDEQHLLDWMAVFPGDFELEALTQVGGQLGLPAGVVADLLGSLVRKCMVEADGGPLTVRYRLLETVRAFAAERLDQRGESDAAALAHADSGTAPADARRRATASALPARPSRDIETWHRAVLTAMRTELAASTRRPELLGRRMVAVGENRG